MAQQTEYPTDTVTVAQSSEVVATGWEASAAPAASVPATASVPPVEPEAVQVTVDQTASASASATASTPAVASAPAVEPVEQEVLTSASASAEASAPAEASASAEPAPVEPVPAASTPPASSAPPVASAPAPVYEAPPADVGTGEETTPTDRTESAAQGDPRPPAEWPISGYPYEGEPCEDRYCGIGGIEEGPLECATYETASGEEVYGCADPRTYEREGCYELTFYTLEGEPYASLNTCEGKKPYAPPEPPEEQPSPDEPPVEEQPPDRQPPEDEEPPLGEGTLDDEEGPPSEEDPAPAEGLALGENAASRPPAGGAPRSAPSNSTLEEGPPFPSGPFLEAVAGDAVGGAVEALEEAAAGILGVLAGGQPTGQTIALYEGQSLFGPETGNQNSDGVTLTDLLFGGRDEGVPVGPPTDGSVDLDLLFAGARSDSGSGIDFGGPPRPFPPTDPAPSLPAAPPAGGSSALSPGGIGGGGGGGPPPSLLCAFFSVPSLTRRGGRLYELLFGPWKPGSAVLRALERPG